MDHDQISTLSATDCGWYCLSNGQQWKGKQLDIPCPLDDARPYLRTYLTSVRVVRYALVVCAFAVGLYWALPPLMPMAFGRIADGTVHEIWIEPTTDGGGILRVVYSVHWHDGEAEYELLAHRQADAFGRPVEDLVLTAADAKRLQEHLNQLAYPNALPARIVVDRNAGQPVNPRLVNTLLDHSAWSVMFGLVLVGLGPLWWFSRRLRLALCAPGLASSQGVAAASSAPLSASVTRSEQESQPSTEPHRDSSVKDGDD